MNFIIIQEVFNVFVPVSVLRLTSVVGLPPTIRNKFVAPCNSSLNLINIFKLHRSVLSTFYQVDFTIWIIFLNILIFSKQKVGYEKHVGIQ